MQPNGAHETKGAKWLQNTQIDGSECIEREHIAEAMAYRKERG